MKGKRLGIIGGMGPKATSVFFDKLIENTVANSDQEHIDIVIMNHATLPDRTTVILEERGEDFLREIKRDFEMLEKAEVSNIAIPCNTSHFFYEEMQGMTTIPIIHMVQETVKEIYEKFGEGSKIGLLATNGTVNSGIYEKECQKYNLNLYTPNKPLQDEVMNIIYNIKADIGSDQDRFEGIVHQLIKEENCRCVILACTELSIIPLRKETSCHTVDAMAVLIEKAIERSGKEVKRKELSNIFV
ncbi:aspartate/glutamate racemase family protein [Sutcliffiella cohnii]|uniref:aspartate/glutamate racemase family protein n=1 Tax=Sutcliffiella cohnii TaxID=33932 RepID=UPI002E1AB873|nr:amino acid racemase [Sutcliffiella cohnii]MED4015811.1 amino acid racemase [Sutcliffiella cohnii]